MSRSEKFIGEHTSNCYNYNSYAQDPIPWLNPDDARKAVEIAREEIIERACDAYCKVCGHYHHTTPNHICRQACDYYKDFKQAMNHE